MGVLQGVREKGAEKNIWRQNDQYLSEFGDSWKHKREASHPMEVVLSKVTADFSSKKEARGRGWKPEAEDDIFKLLEKKRLNQKIHI